MSNNAHNANKKLSAVAIIQEESRLKAVEVRKQDDVFELLWAKSSQDSGTDWRLFAAECGLSAGFVKANRAGARLANQRELDAAKTTVVGFGSTGVAFYHIGLPTAKEDEIKSMVRMQAETLLPLPVEQMELAWRAGRLRNGQVAVTITAARRECLKDFVEDIRDLNPAKILLNCEGVVKAWKEIFGGDDKDAVVVNLTAQSTQVCLAEYGRLSNAVILDMGMDDFLGAAEPPEGELDSEDENELGRAAAIERFIFDIKGALEVFDYAEAVKLPIFVLSDGSGALKGIISSLKSAGLKVKAALPQLRKVKAQTDFGIERLYEYRVPMGLALIALEANADGFDLFCSLYKPAGARDKTNGLYSLKVAGAIAAVTLALFFIISYALDVVSPGAIERNLQTKDPNADINLLMQRQNLIKVVAGERPDLLELLRHISESGNNGIKLETFHFKKGQLVNITGQVQEPDQLYKFQEALMSKNGVKDVKIQNTSRDNKTKKLKFTMTFNYKNFTNKGTRM